MSKTIGKLSKEAKDKIINSIDENWMPAANARRYIGCSGGYLHKAIMSGTFNPGIFRGQRFLLKKEVEEFKRTYLLMRENDGRDGKTVSGRVRVSAKVDLSPDMYRDIEILSKVRNEPISTILSTILENGVRETLSKMSEGLKSMESIAISVNSQPQMQARKRKAA